LRRKKRCRLVLEDLEGGKIAVRDFFFAVEVAWRVLPGLELQVIALHGVAGELPVVMTNWPCLQLTGIELIRRM